MLFLDSVFRVLNFKRYFSDFIKVYNRTGSKESILIYLLNHLKII